MSLALEFVAAIGAVVAALVATVSLVLASARLSLKCVGVGIATRDEEAGTATVRITLAIHNKGRTDINGLEIRCALPGQNLRDAQQFQGPHPRGAGEYGEIGFTPDPPALFELIDGDAHLVTPLVVTAQWGGKVGRMLPLPKGSAQRFTLALDLRPTTLGRLSLRARKALIVARRSFTRPRR